MALGGAVLQDPERSHGGGARRSRAAERDTRKPAREVRVIDTLEIRRGLTRWTVVVAGLAERRGSAEVAAGLYDETPESVAAREQRALERRLARPLGADHVDDWVPQRLVTATGPNPLPR